jgi:hypothetical protein
MGGLDRRLGALEAIAEGTRMRPYREVAARLRITVEEAVDSVAEGKRLLARLVAGGKDGHQILAAFAAELGMPVEELEREAAVAAELFDVGGSARPAAARG